MSSGAEVTRKLPFNYNWKVKTALQVALTGAVLFGTAIWGAEHDHSSPRSIHQAEHRYRHDIAESALTAHIAKSATVRLDVGKQCVRLVQPKVLDSIAYESDIGDSEID